GTRTFFARKRHVGAEPVARRRVAGERPDNRGGRDKLGHDSAEVVRYKRIRSRKTSCLALSSPPSSPPSLPPSSLSPPRCVSLRSTHPTGRINFRRPPPSTGPRVP